MQLSNLTMPQSEHATIKRKSDHATFEDSSIQQALPKVLAEHLKKCVECQVVGRTAVPDWCPLVLKTAANQSRERARQR